MNEQDKEFLQKEYKFCLEMIKHNDLLWNQMLRFYIGVISAISIGVGAFLKFAFENIKSTMPSYKFSSALLLSIVKIKFLIIWPVFFVCLFSFLTIFYLRSKHKKNVEFIRAINNIRKCFKGDAERYRVKEAVSLPANPSWPNYFNWFGTDSITSYMVILTNAFFLTIACLLLMLPSDEILILDLDITKCLWNFFTLFIISTLFQFCVFSGYLYMRDFDK